MSDNAPAETRSGQLHTAVATWIFMIDDAGHRPDDPALCAALDAFRAAAPGSDVDALGQALVAVVHEGLPDDANAERIASWLQGLFGNDAVTTDVGDTREARIQSARRAQFSTNLPWLARIIDRFPGGGVGAHWVLVERVDEQVTCMDPYPWDDLDEEYTQPLTDFLVKWELAGGEGVRWA